MAPTHLVVADPACAPADLKLTGDWDVLVTVKHSSASPTTLHIAPPMLVVMVAEKIDSLPLFNPNAGGWAKAAQLRGVRAQETTTPYLLDPESLALRSGPRRTDAAFRARQGLRGRPYLGHDWPLRKRRHQGRPARLCQLPSRAASP